MPAFPRILFALATAGAAVGQTYMISTVAGGALPVNMVATSAPLYSPSGVAVDKSGNVFFSAGSAVYRMDAISGIITLAAGTGVPGSGGDNGPATSAQLYSPQGLAFDSRGNLYIADFLNDRIRKVSNGVMTTVAGVGGCCSSGNGDNGPAIDAALHGPTSIALDSKGNLYIAEEFESSVREVTGNIITTIAGGGMFGLPGVGGVTLMYPQGVAVDAADNLYIADTGDGRVLELSNGNFTIVAGNGYCCLTTALSLTLSNPRYIAIDASGALYISDDTDNVVAKVAKGVISVVAGTGEPGYDGTGFGALAVQLNGPQGIAFDGAGDLFIADSGNYRIRKVSGGITYTIAGNGVTGFSGDNGLATTAELNSPAAVAVDSAGNIYIADTANQRVRKVSAGVITTVAGNGLSGYNGDGGPASSASLYSPSGLVLDLAGNLYIGGDNRVRKVSGGVITTVAGTGVGGFSGDNGPATAAQINFLGDLAVDSAGSIYIGDYYNNRIRKVANGIITTIAGHDQAGYSGDNGPAVYALLARPSGVATDSSGSLYIADTFSGVVRRIANGSITTVAGTGTRGFGGDGGPATSAELADPSGVAVDSSGNLYIADLAPITGGPGGQRIRKVSTGVITTIAGGGSVFGDSGPATSAVFNGSFGVGADSAGNVYVADTSDNRIRLLTPGPLPAINQNGIVPNESTVPIIQPGSWVSIYGSNFASSSFLWNADFPLSLGGVSVTIDSKNAYLLSVSPTQINVQAPDDTATGLVSVVVTTASGTAATSTVTLALCSPSFSVLGDGKHVAGEIATPNGTGAYGAGTYDLDGPSGAFSFNTRPVNAGETLVLYGVGFGPTTPPVAAGHVFSGAAPTNTPVTISIGGVNANVAFAGITQAGLYQLNLTVPAGTGSGDQPIQAIVNGVPTPSGPVVTVR